MKGVHHNGQAAILYLDLAAPVVLPCEPDSMPESQSGMPFPKMHCSFYNIAGFHIRETEEAASSDNVSLFIIC